MLRFQRLPSLRSTSLHTDVGAPPPDAFGPFRVLHQVGVGILGPVFRAYDPERDRLVAVKLFQLDEPPDRAHRLIAELEPLIANALAHPAIVTPLAAGISGACAYLVTDFASADSAELYFRGRTRGLAAEVARVVTELAGALDCARAAGVWHGALHPRDVLVTEEDVRLTGLGIAQALDRSGIASTARRPYAAPERLEGRAWGADADTFSLGALAFEFLAGRRVAGLGADAASWLPEVEGVSVTALRSVFARVLAADPLDRFRSAGEFAQTLRDVLAGRPSSDAEDTPRPRAPRKPRRAPKADPVPVPAAAASTFGFETGDAVVADLGGRNTTEESVLRAGATESNAEPVESFAQAEPPEAVEAIPIVKTAPDDAMQPETAEPSAAALETAAPATAEAERAEPLSTASRVDPERTRESASADRAVDRKTDRAPDLDTMRETPAAPPEVPASLVRTFAASAASNTVVWPLVLALAVGVAIGFAGGYATAARRAALGAAVLDLPGDLPPNAVVSAAAASPTANGGQDIALRDQAGFRAQAGSGGESLAVPDKAEPSPREAPAAAGRAGLIIQSKPAGGRVFVDGALVGTTPVTVARLAAGRHDVRIEHDGYRPWSRTVKAAAGGRQRIAASLAR